MQNEKMSVTTVVARYQETDQMGIVHHSVYPIWFEVGRTELIKLYGITYTQMEAGGIILPLIGLECSYKNAARYEDVLQIRSSIDGVTNTRLDFFYEITREEGEGKSVLIATGKTRHIFANTGMKPLNIKKVRPDYLEMFLH